MFTFHNINAGGHRFPLTRFRCSRDELCQGPTTIWGASNRPGTDLMSRSLDAHISRLRKVLGLRPESGKRLASIYGQRYRFESIGSDNEHGAG